MGNCCLEGPLEHFLTPFSHVLCIVNSKGWLCNALFSYFAIFHKFKPSVTQSSKGVRKTGLKKNMNLLTLRRCRTLPILLSMLSSPFLHLGQPMCQHASMRWWEIYEISKMSPIWRPESPKLTIIWPLRMGLALSLFCDFWHDPSVDLAVGVCWWEIYGIPKMAQMWIPESLKHTICRPCGICFAFLPICHL